MENEESLGASSGGLKRLKRSQDQILHLSHCCACLYFLQKKGTILIGEEAG